MGLLDEIRNVPTNTLSLEWLKEQEKWAIKTTAALIYEDLKKFVLQEASLKGEAARSGFYTIAETSTHKNRGLDSYTSDDTITSIYVRKNSSIAWQTLQGKNPYSHVGISADISYNYRQLGSPRFENLCDKNATRFSGNLKHNPDISLHTDYESLLDLSLNMAFGLNIYEKSNFFGMQKFTYRFNNNFNKLYVEMFEIAAKDGVAIYPALNCFLYNSPKNKNVYWKEFETLTVPMGYSISNKFLGFLYTAENN